MKFWHRHRWVEIDRAFTGPAGRLIEAKGFSGTLQRLAFGVTTVISQCALCGRLSTLEVLGDARRKP